MNLSKIGLFLLKFAVSGGLIWLLLRKIDLGPLELRLTGLQSEPLVFALVILFAQLLLTGLRWCIVTQILGVDIRIGLATKLSLIGQLFNQVLPSSVGGDGVRVWLLSREGVPIKRVLVSVICDRLIALVLLVVIAACVLPIIIAEEKEVFPSAQAFTLGLDILTFLGLITLFAWGNNLAAFLARYSIVRPFGILLRELRKIIFSSKRSLEVIFLCIIVQVMIVLSIFFCGEALGIELNWIQLLMLPLILLLSAIPISFAGWGLRESTMVVGLGFVGVTATDALAISISFGLAQFIIGLPGLVLSLVSVYGKKKIGCQSQVFSAK